MKDIRKQRLAAATGRSLSGQKLALERGKGGWVWTQSIIVQRLAPTLMAG